MTKMPIFSPAQRISVVRHSLSGGCYTEYVGRANAAIIEVILMTKHSLTQTRLRFHDQDLPRGVAR